MQSLSGNSLKEVPLDVCENECKQQLKDFIMY